jgi:signal transduction histidine kinase
VASEQAPDFRALFEQAPALLLVLRPDEPRFTIVSASDAHLRATMTTREEIVGRGLFEAFPSNPADPKSKGEHDARASLRRVLVDKRTDTLTALQYDIRKPASEGGGFEERFWTVTHSPVLDANGDVAYVLVRAEDVTETTRVRRRFGALEAEVFRRTQEIQEANRKLEARGRELEETNRDLDSFSYSVSHDLRAPLRAVDGFAKILLEDHAAQLGDEGKRVAGVICRNTEKMRLLIDDLLAFSRLGRAPLQLGPVDMGSLARAVATELVDPTRTIDVHIGGLPRCWGDPSLLRQVWINLLGNAMKYTRSRDRATIEVSGRSEDGAAVYEVRDNGVGFDPKYASKLFGVFQRLHGATEYEGTGVGLALVHRIVRRHDGWVRGDGRPGEGATFTFALHEKES